MSKLLDCKCGGYPYHRRDTRTIDGVTYSGRHVECKDCGAFVWWKTTEEAIKGWNDMNSTKLPEVQNKSIMMNIYVQIFFCWAILCSAILSLVFPETSQTSISQISFSTGALASLFVYVVKRTWSKK